MRRLGFDGYALDYVECPEGLKWFLKKECNFHRNVHLISLYLLITLNPSHPGPCPQREKC